MYRAGEASLVREPDEELGRLCAVLAVHDVSHPADGQGEKQRGGRHVGDDSDGLLGHQRGHHSAYEAADQAPPYREAALPHVEELLRPVLVDVPVVDDERQPRPDEPADDGPYRDRVDGVGVDPAKRRQPAHQQHGGRDCHEAEEAVPAYRQPQEARDYVGVNSDLDHVLCSVLVADLRSVVLADSKGNDSKCVKRACRFRGPLRRRTVAGHGL